MWLLDAHIVARPLTSLVALDSLFRRRLMLLTSRWKNVTLISNSLRLADNVQSPSPPLWPREVPEP